MGKVRATLVAAAPASGAKPERQTAGSATVDRALVQTILPAHGQVTEVSCGGTEIKRRGKEIQRYRSTYNGAA